jgi:hypothetical protein
MFGETVAVVSFTGAVGATVATFSVVGALIFQVRGMFLRWYMRRRPETGPLFAKSRSRDLFVAYRANVRRMVQPWQDWEARHRINERARNGFLVLAAGGIVVFLISVVL